MAEVKRRERFKKGERVRIGPEVGTVIDPETSIYPAHVRLDNGRLLNIADRLLLPEPEPTLEVNNADPDRR